jgi:hypothetical protein
MENKAGFMISDEGECVKVPQGYCRSGIPKGFAAFFHKNDAEIGVYWKQTMMAWVNRDNCHDVARMAVSFSYREHLKSLEFLGPLGDQGDYMRADLDNAYQKEMDEIFVAEFCAPKGTSEFFGVSMPKECESACCCKANSD